MGKKKTPAPRRAGNRKAVAVAKRAVGALRDPDDLLVVVLFVEGLAKKNRRVTKRH